MADVYEGVDTRLRRAVAVKVFRPGTDPQTEDRLTAEAVLLARLQHPGLVTVYDAGRDADRTYLVMELVDGPTLRSLLERGALPQRRVADLGSALAGALAHVHRAGIVHRDVKPSNVLIDSAGDPHLADFGIARLANATRHTAPDVMIGTAAYLAPEQVEGRPVGPAADVYALGLVLLECLKGELEYQGTPLEAAVARLHRSPTVPTWLPPDLAALLRAMTAPAPQARPDAEQCVKALASLCAEADPYVLPPSAPPEARLPAGVALADAGEHIRTAEESVTGHHLPGRSRHSRRLAVGTALAALSVAVGTTFAAAPGTSGHSGDRADAASSAATPAHPSSGTATPDSKPGAVPPTASHRMQPYSRTPGTSGPTAPSTGSHAESASGTSGSSLLAAPTSRTPDRHDGTEPRKPAPQHSRDGKDRTSHGPKGAPKPSADDGASPPDSPSPSGSASPQASASPYDVTPDEG